MKITIKNKADLDKYCPRQYTDITLDGKKATIVNREYFKGSLAQYATSESPKYSFLLSDSGSYHGTYIKEIYKRDYKYSWSLYSNGDFRMLNNIDIKNYDLNKNITIL